MVETTAMLSWCKNVVLLEKRNQSVANDSDESKETGRWFPGKSACSDLHLNITLAFFSAFGKIPNEIHLFTILVSGKATSLEAVVLKNGTICRHIH